MISLLEFDFKDSKEDLELREEFNKIISNCFIEKLSRERNKFNDFEFDTYKSNKNLIKSKISINFLKKNIYLVK